MIKYTIDYCKSNKIVIKPDNEEEYKFLKLKFEQTANWQLGKVYRFENGIDSYGFNTDDEYYERMGYTKITAKQFIEDNTENNTMEKPQTFNITGKPHHIKSIIEDLKEQGYIIINGDFDSWTSISHNWIDKDKIFKNKDRFIELYKSTQREKNITFTLPAQYQECLEFTLAQINHEYWNKPQFKEDDLVTDDNGNTIHVYSHEKNDKHYSKNRVYPTFYNECNGLYFGSKLRLTTKEEIELLSSKIMLKDSSYEIKIETNIFNNEHATIDGHTFSYNFWKAAKTIAEHSKAYIIVGCGAKGKIGASNQWKLDLETINKVLSKLDGK